MRIIDLSRRRTAAGRPAPYAGGWRTAGRRRRLAVIGPVILLIAVVATVLAAPSAVDQPGWGRAAALRADPVIQTVREAAAEPEVGAASAVLMGADSRRILWERDGAARRAPASTTKIMTALVVAGLAQPDQEVTASRRAAATPGSSIWLGEGETLDVGDLLYGLLLTSGNDAAVALAEHVAGSVEGFAVLMNAKAREIGAEETNFRNPHGLDEPGHYTTARDLALITAAALEDPLLAKVVATKKVEIAWPGHNAERVLRNKNRLLWEYDGADGVKTGFTDSAGKCLVASATRNGLQLVAVVMGSPGIWADSRALLDFGFATFSPKVVVRRGEIFRTARVAGGDRERLALAASADLVVPVRRGEEGGVEVVQEGGLQLRAPIKAGSLCGRVRALVDGEEVGSVILLAADDVRAQTVYRSFWGKLWSLFRMMVRNITAAAHRR